MARDWQQDRLYLPQSTLDQAGYTPQMLARGEYNPAFRRVMQVEVERAQEYLRAGEPLARQVSRELQLDVRLFAAGGLAVAQAIRQADYNVWKARPTLSKATQLALLARCWWQSKRARGRKEPAQ